MATNTKASAAASGSGPNVQTASIALAARMPKLCPGAIRRYDLNTTLSDDERAALEATIQGTPAWKGARNMLITSSWAKTAANIDTTFVDTQRFSGALYSWLVLTGRLFEEDDANVTRQARQRMDHGTMMEPYIRQAYEKVLQQWYEDERIAIRQSGLQIDRQCNIRACSPDGTIVYPNGTTECLEIKSPYSRLSSELYAGHMAQLQWNMHVMNVEVAHYVVLHAKKVPRQRKFHYNGAYVWLVKRNWKYFDETWSRTSAVFYSASKDVVPQLSSITSDFPNIHTVARRYELPEIEKPFNEALASVGLLG